jgi:glycerol-3-phosphate acyltransferase PlsY
MTDVWFASLGAAVPWLAYFGAFLAGYAAGSIPFGLIYGHAGGAGDIRKVGSGNIGATNVLRTGRKDLALLTLLSDAAKGFVPVILCRLYLGAPFDLFVAAGAFAGHLFPVWLKFKGGKGVATYIGIVFALNWLAGACFCAIWLGVAILTRYSSLSALVAAALTPLVALMALSPALAAFLGALSAVLIARHHQNIRNLLSGRESKIKLQAAAK